MPVNLLNKMTKADLKSLIFALSDENNDMFNRIENLELYLEFIRVKYPGAWKNLRKNFPGLPGHISKPVKKVKEKNEE